MRIFTSLQEEIIKEISRTPLKDSFFLTGGTALSVFYLQHRYSNARKKHMGLDDYWLAQALRYINDLTILPRMIKPVSLKELQDFFNIKIKSLMTGL